MSGATPLDFSRHHVTFASSFCHPDISPFSFLWNFFYFSPWRVLHFEGLSSSPGPGSHLRGPHSARTRRQAGHGAREPGSRCPKSFVPLALWAFRRGGSEEGLSVHVGMPGPLRNALQGFGPSAVPGAASESSDVSVQEGKSWFSTGSGTRRRAPPKPPKKERNSREL